MQHNRIHISLTFSFRGETFTPTVELDLDACMRKFDGVPNLYDVLGEQIGIDEFRHEYDVMAMEEINFDHVEGFVAEYIVDGMLDAERFAARWHEAQAIETLQAIAEKHLGINNLAEHPETKSALLAAYHHGRKHR